MILGSWLTSGPTGPALAVNHAYHSSLYYHERGFSAGRQAYDCPTLAISRQRWRPDAVAPTFANGREYLTGQGKGHKLGIMANKEKE